ncbi:hypothetical protein D3C79_934550 [compost metagenome]
MLQQTQLLRKAEIQVKSVLQLAIEIIPQRTKVRIPISGLSAKLRAGRLYKRSQMRLVVLLTRKYGITYSTDSLRSSKRSLLAHRSDRIGHS